MAQNNLPDKQTALFTLAESMAAGLAVHEQSLGVKQNTAETIGDALDNARLGERAYDANRALKPARTKATTDADTDAKVFLATARDILKTVFGPHWNHAWVEAGFVGGSISIPDRTAERMELVKRLNLYFSGHPTREVASLQVTAARAAAIHAQLNTTRTALNTLLTSTTSDKSSRDAAVTALRVKLRGTIAEIRQLMADDDPRWYAFGLVPPALAALPDVPDGLVLTAGAAGSGTVYLDWDDAPRAERYRLWRQLPGETEPVALDSVTESDATLTGQPLGQPIAFLVSAANATGESLRSEAVTITLA